MKEQRKKYSRGPTEVDQRVGEEIRRRRILLGLSQERLADGLGVTFQQLQKYERGRNRVSASRLFRVARLLNAPISDFFEGLDEGAEAPVPGLGEELPSDVWQRRETLKLLRNYYSIGDERVRQQIGDMLKGIASLKVKSGVPEVG